MIKSTVFALSRDELKTTIQALEYLHDIAEDKDNVPLEQQCEQITRKLKRLAQALEKSDPG
jgi:hypothetical protein